MMRRMLLIFGLGWCLALPARGADITPGYTFSSGEQNITHTKLNNAAAGTVNRTFYSLKSASTAPSTSVILLTLDSADATFKRSTLNQAFFNHTALINDRTAKSALAVADAFLIWDSADSSYKKVYWTNTLFSGTAFSGTVSTNDTLPFFDASAGTMHTIQVSNLIMGAASLGDEDGDESFAVVTGAGNYRRMTTRQIITAATDLQGAGAVTGDDSVWILKQSTQAPRETRVMDFFQAGNVKTALAASDSFGLTDASVVARTTYQSIRSNALSAYVRLEDRQASGTEGGGVTNSWSVRRINTIVADPLGLVTHGPGATNAFTLAAGVYRWRVTCPGFQIGIHQGMLTNISGGAVAGLCQNGRASTGDSTMSVSEGSGLITNAAAVVYGVRHRATTQNNTDGGGSATGWGTEIYTTVEFWRLD